MRTRGAGYEHGLRYRALCWLLAPAGWLVSAQIRERWLEEWRGELWHAAGATSGWPATTRLFRRALGSYVDALALRGGPSARSNGSRSHHRRHQVREGARDMFLQDLRHAWRSLQKTPGFTAVAALTLALGLGANAAIFSVVDGVLLKPLPFPEPERIVVVWGQHPEIGTESASLPDATDWRDQNRSFEHFAFWSRRGTNLTGGEKAERLISAAVARGFFQVVGMEPELGRDFEVSEDQPGAPRVAILSHGLWQRRFGGASEIVGGTIELDGESTTVVGVAPPGFNFPRDTELWQPLAMDAAQAHRRADFLGVVGRLRAGVSLEQAQEEMSAIAARLEREYPDTNSDWGILLVPILDQMVGEVRPALLVLLAAVFLVLLIACANVANLLLTRLSARSGELAVRTALGASRFCLVRQLLVEALLLAGLGGALGVALAWVGVRALRAFGPRGLPRLDAVELDGRVLLFAAIATVATALVFGALPSLRVSRAGIDRSLRQSGGRSGQSRADGRLRSALVAAQMAVAVVLLVGAGLLLRSFFLLRSVDLGFRHEGLATVRISLPEKDYAEERVPAFFAELAERTRAIPGVVAASAIDDLPVRDGANYFAFAIEGRPQLDPSVVQDAESMVVLPGYFETVGIPLRSGRLLDERDREGAELVIVINQTLAEKDFPGEDPLDRRITFGDGPDALWYRIVGVVGDTRQTELAQKPYPQNYRALAQTVRRSLALVVRTAGGADGMDGTVREVQRVARELDPNLPVYQVGQLTEILQEALAQPRFNYVLLLVFAATALTLAAVGLYGVLAFTVARRTREIGLRMALGADARRVRAEVAGGAAWLIGIGGGIGLLAALGASRLLRTLLYGIGPLDAATFAVVPAVLLATAALAVSIPAWRASRIDPATALREE